MSGAVDPHRRVTRFDGRERALHWINALSVLWLLLSGGLILLDRPGLIGMDQPSLRFWHYVTGFSLAAAPLLGLLWSRRDLKLRRRLRLLLWDWESDDWRWLAAVARVLVLGRARPPRVGDFNAGQKLNARAVLVLGAGLGATGVVIANGGLFPSAWPATAYSLHDLMALPVVALVAGHLVLTMLWRPTRPSLRGMVDGTVDEAWARRHHPLAWREPTAPEVAPEATAEAAAHSEEAGGR